MRSEKKVRSSGAAAEAAEEAAMTDGAYEAENYEIFRVTCPDCAQPIALLAEEDQLPEHGLCASAWDPFGLTVCPGSGRAACEAAPLSGDVCQDQGLAALLTLPAGLDWRMQPFSHAGLMDERTPFAS